VTKVAPSKELNSLVVDMTPSDPVEMFLNMNNELVESGVLPGSPSKQPNPLPADIESL